MKYSVFVINSINANDYWNDAADGIKYSDLTKEEANILMELSLKQNFSVIMQKV